MDKVIQEEEDELNEKCMKNNVLFDFSKQLAKNRHRIMKTRNDITEGGRRRKRKIT